MRKVIVMNSIEETHRKLNESAERFVQTWFYNSDPMDSTKKEYLDQLKVILDNAYRLGATDALADRVATKSQTGNRAVC